MSENEALGIPFNLLAVAEKDENYREIIKENNCRRSRVLLEKDIHNSLEDLLGSTPRPKLGQASLAVTGSPCNPFSTKRNKRFADGSIANHSMSGTTLTSTVIFYRTFEPEVGITEQVKGFDMRTSTSDAETPCDRPDCVVSREGI